MINKILDVKSRVQCSIQSR